MGNRVVLITVGLLLAAPCVHAADQCTVGIMLTLPVTMSGRSPVVMATLNGRERRFIVDSGAFYSMLSSGVAAEENLRLKRARYGLTVVGLGGTVVPSVAKVEDFTLGGITLHDIQFLVTGDYVGYAGLLGQNILGVADAEYDIGHGKLRLLKPKHCSSDTNFAYWSGKTPVSVLSLRNGRNDNNQAVAELQLNGVTIDALFDTGAATSVLTLQAAKRAGIDPDSPGVRPAGLVRGIGSDVVKSWTGPFKSLAIGNAETIRNVRLRFANLRAVPGLDFDMLIGVDFFLSHHVYVANSTGKMFITYNGGPVFDLSVNPITGGVKELSTAAAYSGRGTAFAARKQYALALADLNRACELEPDNPLYRYQRAMIELAMNDQVAALADLDAALELAPEEVRLRLARSHLRLRRGDWSGAQADLDAAAKVAAKSDDHRLDMARLYGAMAMPTAAIKQYGLWIDAHAGDSRLPSALNGRCWERALSGHDLDAALDDCNRAVELRPDRATYRDSRGLVWLRMGEWKNAIEDYNGALEDLPNQAWSYYGRGIARRHIGQTAKGDADIAAAKAINPHVADEAKQYGIVP